MDKSIILMSDYKCIIPLYTICVFCLYRDIEYCGNDLQGHNTLLTERLDDMPQKRSLHDIFNLKSHTLKIVVLVLLFAASTALGVIVPLLEQQLIDDGLIKLDTNVVLRFSVLFLLVISISKGIEFLELSIQNKIQTDVGIKLKQKIFEHAFQLKPSQYQKDGFLKMFNTTIIENVFINKNEEPEDPEKTVRKYSDMLGPNIISRLYDTTGSEGSFLSGGEKQKIALTRALCHKRKILLLDEAASNLDFASHQKMLDLVLSSTDFDIVFVVTHDHKELSRYDRILRLEKGQLTVIKQDWS